VDDLIVGVPTELEGGVGWLGCGVHRSDIMLVQISVNVSRGARGP
jgi:hypothetical protein